MKCEKERRNKDSAFLFMETQKKSVLSVLYLTKLVFLYGTKFRIERHQLSSGIVSSELPLDTSCMFIALPLPCRQFLAEQIYVLNPAGQTLPCHYI